MTPKQEAFVHAYCTNGGNGTQAAIAAGYAESGAEVRASELVRNIKVAAEIRRFKATMAERAAVTVESLTRDLESHMRKALELDQPSAAITATMGIAKLHGLLTEDRKNDRTPLKEVLSRIERESGTKPKLFAVK